MTIDAEPGEAGQPGRHIWVLATAHADELIGPSVVDEMVELTEDYERDVVCYDADASRITSIEPDFFLRRFLELDLSQTDDGITRGSAVGGGGTTRVEPFSQFLFDFGPLVISESLQHEPALSRLKPRQLINAPADSGGGDAIHGVGRDLEASRHRGRLLDLLADALGEMGALEGEDSELPARRKSGRAKRVHIYSWSLAEQRVAASIYQAVFDSALDLAGRPLDETWMAQQPTPELCSMWSNRGLPVPDTNLDLINTTLDFLAAGTVGFGPRLEVVADLDRSPAVWGSVIPKVLAAMCVQAVAFIGDGIPVSRCENPNCRRPFARQVGRAKQGQNRSHGFKYCSTSCAKSVAMREYRQRRRLNARGSTDRAKASAKAPLA